MSKNKYNAKKMEVDGITFDSRLEGRRYIVLKAAQDNGHISELKTQVPFELLPNMYEEVAKQLKTKVKIIQKLVQRKVIYTADFTYVKDGQLVVEDTKGSNKYLMYSRDYPLRKKMMYYFHGIKIREVTKATDNV